MFATRLGNQSPLPDRLRRGKLVAEKELAIPMELVESKTEVRSPVKASATNLRRVPPERANPGWSILKQILGLLVMTCLAYGCFQLSQRYVLQSVRVSGSSMSPTLPDSNCYLLNRLVYHFRAPQPEDIVVLRDPADQGYAVKRIVAKPGDSVYVKGGRIFVNGVLLKERYLTPDTQTYAGPDYPAQFWICGAHQYFVLGDNRNNSVDSRIYGAVPQENILGMVMP